MTATVALGPYEHTGAYSDRAESDVFDTSGTEDGFCEICEHAPCVAGAKNYCRLWPRAIVVHAIQREISFSDLPWSPHMGPLAHVTGGLAQVAIHADEDLRDRSLLYLVAARDGIRRAIRERAEVTP